MRPSSPLPHWNVVLATAALLVAPLACKEEPKTVEKVAEQSSSAPKAPAAPEPGGDTIKVGILHSLSGTMAISETSLRDVEPAPLGPGAWFDARYAVRLFSGRLSAVHRRIARHGAAGARNVRRRL